MITDNAMPYDDEAHLHRRSFASRSSLSLSPDGQWIAVVAKGLASGQAAVAGDDEAEPLKALDESMVGSEILVVNAQTGQMQRPFHDFNSSCLPAWSPDGKWLALVTQSGARRLPRLTLWSSEHETPRVFDAVTVSPTFDFEVLRWTGDSRHIVFTAVPEPAPEKPIVTRVASDEPEMAKFPLKTVGVLNVESGHVPYFGSLSWTQGWRVSPDNRRVAFSRYVELPEKPQNVQTLWRQLVVMNLADGAEQLIGEPQAGGWGCSFNWSPDGDAIAWLADGKILVAEFGRDSHLSEIALPEDTNFGFLDWDWYPPPAPLWDRTSSAFYLPGQAKLWRFLRDGTIGEGITLPEGPGFDWCSNSIAALDFPHTTSIGEDSEVWLSRPLEVWKVNLTTQAVELAWKKERPHYISNEWIERAYDATCDTLYTVHNSEKGELTLYGTLRASGKTRVVCTLFGEVQDCAYGQLRSLSWTLPDGTDCGGSLLLPLGWSEGDKPPVVMNVYGDDRDQGRLGHKDFSWRAPVDLHLLSANGYAVFVPDMPETDEHPAASLVVAGEAAANALRQSGLVNADHIAAMGGSYGGYTTLCLLTGSKIFKVGIVFNGLYDLLRSATDTLLSWGFTESGQGRMHCSMWENPTRYIENSPLYALDKLEAPLLILQGEADFNLEQGQALFSSLRRLGKRGEMLTYRDGGHVPTSWSIAAQLDWHQRLMAFLSQHLKEKPIAS